MTEDQRHQKEQALKVQVLYRSLPDEQKAVYSMIDSLLAAHHVGHDLEIAILELAARLRIYPEDDEVPASGADDPAFEPHFKLIDLFHLWRFSVETIRPYVNVEPGVCWVTQPGAKRATPSIPKSVARRIHTKMVAAGAAVQEKYKLKAIARAKKRSSRNSVNKLR